MNILEGIVAHKRAELAAQVTSLDAVRDAAKRAPRPRGFRAAIEREPAPGIIAECKRASPSQGVLHEGPWDPAALAKRYEEAGARCLSVLTDTRFFWGQLTDLVEVRQAVELPILRKDFVIDPYQVWEARVAGADAVLLIAAVLDGDALGQLQATAQEAGLEVLVEVHDEAEARRAIDTGAGLVGVNNRNLDTFEVDLAVTERIAPLLVEAGCTVVGESGVHTADDAALLVRAGAKGLLVGEALVRAADPGALIAALGRSPQ